VAPLAMVAVIVGYGAARVLHWHAMPDIARPLSGPLLIAAFLAGVTAYLYRARLSASHLTGAALLLVSLVLLGLPGLPQFLAPIPVAWLTAYLGTLNPARIRLLRGADYSYGLYLYGLPIEQALIASLPIRHWLFTAVGALALAGLFAAFSWTYVEKPALKLRGALERLEKRWIALFA
jgi:peptidoglycan/LPS O-acetylase OafA/YrhL